MPNAGSKFALIVAVALHGLASASSPEKISAGAIHKAAATQVSLLRAPQKGEGDPTAGSASVPSAFTQTANGFVKHGALAKHEDLLAPLKDVKFSAASAVQAGGAGFKRMSPASDDALSARRKDAQVAAPTAAGAVGDLSGKTSFEMVAGAYYTAGKPDANANNTVTASDSGGRKLQGTTCTADSFSVTSSEFPLLEGCLSEIEIFEGGFIEYLNEAGTGFVYATVPSAESDAPTEGEYWFAQYLTALSSDAEQIPACNSEEPASLVHPADATWICLFDDESVDYGTATTFGVDCGCDGSDDDGTVPSPDDDDASSETVVPVADDDEEDDDSSPTSVVPSTGDDDNDDGDDAPTPSAVPASAATANAWSFAIAAATGLIAVATMGRW